MLCDQRRAKVESCEAWRDARAERGVVKMSFGGFPPETPDAHCSFAAASCALVDEDLLIRGRMSAADRRGVGGGACGSVLWCGVRVGS